MMLLILSRPSDSHGTAETVTAACRPSRVPDPAPPNPAGQLRGRRIVASARDVARPAGDQAAGQRTGAGRMVQQAVHAAGREFLIRHGVQTDCPG